MPASKKNNNCIIFEHLVFQNLYNLLFINQEQCWHVFPLLILAIQKKQTKIYDTT
jgi:hypothetical protein